MPAKDRDRLLSSRICDLSLEIPGTHLEELVSRLYTELGQSGLSFRPKTYLSDEWGCPQGVPVIGIPFYLAKPELHKLECEISGVDAENDAEVMMFLRHEAGHAFNYAYRLYEKVLWKRIFGKFDQSYHESYTTRPFSADFVRHVPGWYGQKHPDEDFAETFAVWLTPCSNWQKSYCGTPAIKKLRYVDRVARSYGGKKPLVSELRLDKPVRELTMTLDTWYEERLIYSKNGVKLPRIIDLDLTRLFTDKDGKTAKGILKSKRGEIIRQVNNWTGLDRYILSALFDELVGRSGILGLKIATGKVNRQLTNFSTFLTTLAMNYQTSRHFVESGNATRIRRRKNGKA
jgi:hypothetical protein